MVGEAKKFWAGLEGAQKVLSIGAILVMGFSWLFMGHFQVLANTKDIQEIRAKQEEYEKIVRRIDRRLYHLEIANDINSEPVDEASTK